MASELRIVRGVPTDEELAALVGVLLLRSPATEPAGVANRWIASARPRYAYRDGRPTRPGAGAWRSSALPR